MTSINKIPASASLNRTNSSSDLSDNNIETMITVIEPSDLILESVLVS